ncbi:MAG: hypothetical protein ACXWNV_19395, partial [Vulcanimicrobiaceae bacterium]
MNTAISPKRISTILSALAATAALLAGAALTASAQTYPAYQNGGYHDRYDQRGSYEGRGGQIQGRVTYFNHFDMQVDTQNGRSLPIHLHQGTVINPTGTTLQNGMNVAISGTRNSDGSFNANEIDVMQQNGYGRG